MPDIAVNHPVLCVWTTGFLFALIHSLMAASTCKTRCYAAGVSPRGYRLVYVGVSLLAGAVWLVFVHALPDTFLYRSEGMWRWLLNALQLCGLWLFWLSLRPIDLPAFLGLRPFAQGIEPFIEHGIYRHLRHPMYTGLIIVMFAHPEQSVNSLNLYACITAYFAIGSRFEERRMLAMHPHYADYRRRVPAFIPRLFRANL